MCSRVTKTLDFRGRNFPRFWYTKNHPSDPYTNSVEQPYKISTRNFVQPHKLYKVASPFRQNKNRIFVPKSGWLLKLTTPKAGCEINEDGKRNKNCV
eukprot:TRINITY_DN7468_c0_g1_i1.p1 TRINITY_DN7468_c0_g1~~TRINITY_DN7468_c0_g1_i1.p1  ORF type:complete len:97 (-),score=2.67 TRINITY_DN7468_c0_g1_i1:414-704(-)